MAKITKFKVSRTVDEETKEEEITVTDMEVKEEKEVIDTGENTYDAAEIKEVADMCKDMGFESIKDAVAELKAAKDKAAKDEKIDDEDPEAEEIKKKKATADAAMVELETGIAAMVNPEEKEAMIKLVSKVKDNAKGYTVKDTDMIKEIFKATTKDAVKAEKQPNFNMDDYLGASNPHKN